MKYPAYKDVKATTTDPTSKMLMEALRILSTLPPFSGKTEEEVFETIKEGALSREGGSSS